MTINWVRDAANPLLVTVTVEQAWRRGFPNFAGNNNIGNTPRTGFLRWGDGTFSAIEPEIVEVNVGDDWFIAKGTLQRQYAATTSVRTLSLDDCCRIFELEEGNAGQYYRISTSIDFGPGGDMAGPRVTGIPIVPAYRGVTKLFPVPAQPASGRELSYRIAPTSESRLVDGTPDGLTIDASTGLVTWNPTAAQSSAAGKLFAFQAQVFQHAPGGSIATATVQSSLDFIFRVRDDAPTSLGVPTISADNPVTAFIGFEVSFTVTATDSQADSRVQVVNNALPTNAFFGACQEGQSASDGFSLTNTCTRVFRWTPLLGDQDTDVILYSQAKSVDGDVFQSDSLRVTIQIGQADTLFMSGIVRDFPASHVDFDRADGDLGRQIVESALGTDGKPVFRASAGSVSVSSAASFDQWWRTEDGVNTEDVYSITLSNAADATGKIFTFTSTSFFPDAGNRWFTYEINTFVTYEGGEEFTFRSADDMWLFVDGRLAIDLGGVHAPAQGVVSLDSFGLTVGTTYSFDIFFAHRGRRDPNMQVQATEAVICNVVSSGVTSVDFSSGFASAGSSLLLNGVASVQAGGALRLADRGSPFFAGSAWQAAPQRILNGFRTSFKFRATAPAGSTPEGFAFVFQRAGSAAIGGAGSNLGYEGITRSVAVEFDMKQDAGLGDATAESVAVHSRYELANDASEAFALATAAPVPDGMSLADGAVHEAEVTYVPALFDPAAPAGVLRGWLRVFLDGDVVPIVSAQVDDSELRSMLNGAAYVGFTSASGSDGTEVADIEVTEWTLDVVPPSAGSTSAVSQPAGIAAGAQGSFRVQARDACRNDITLGGDLDQFAATMTRGGGATAFAGVSVHDLGNGQYEVRYAPTVADTYEVAVTFGGSPVQGSPWTLEVRPAGPSALFSDFTAPGAAATGSPAQFTITARDRFDNALVIGGDEFDVSFSPATPTAPAVTDVGDGTYSVEWQSDEARAYQVYVKYDAVDIVGSPATATVVAGGADAERSVLTGTGLFSASADSPASFDLQPFDANGNRIQAPGSDSVTSELTLRTDSGTTVAPACAWNAGALAWRCTYQGTVAGVYDVAVTVNGGAKSNSFEPRVTPGAATAAQSGIVTPVNGGGAVSAGTPMTLRVQARDQHGNALEAAEDGLQFFVEFLGAGSLVVDQGTVEGQAFAYDGSGLYRIAYTPQKAADGSDAHSVRVSFQGTASLLQNGSGATQTVGVRVGPGAASAAQSSFAASAGAGPVTAGNAYQFTITARDAFSNLRFDGGDADDFVVAASRDSDSAQAAVAAVAQAGDGSTGTYTGSWNATLAGDYTQSVRLFGGSVDVSAGASASVEVVAGPTDAPSCTVTGSTGGGTEQTDITLRVVARDRFGNERDAAEHFRSRVRQGGAFVGSPQAAAYDGTGGGYSLNYTVPAWSSGAGADNSFDLLVEFSADDSSYDEVATYSAVSLEDASLTSGAYAYGPGLAAGVAGATETFTVQQASADNSTQAAEGGGNFRVTVRKDGTGDDVSSGVTDNGDGTYTVSYRATVTGTYQVRIFFNLVIESTVTEASPYSLAVSPGPVSTANSVVTGLPVSGMPSGSSRQVTVALRDEFNNAYTASNGAVTLEGATTLSEDVAVTSNTDNGDGTYTIDFTAVTAALKQVTVTNGGTPLGALSGFLVEVVPGEPAAANCTASAPPAGAGVLNGLSEGVAGRESTLLVELRDANGNPTPVPDQDFFVGLAAHAAVAYTATTDDGVTYTVRFTPEVSGTHALSVRLGTDASGGLVAAQTFDVAVSPAAVDAPTSYLEALGGGVSQQPLSFRVLARDRFGNAVPGLVVEALFSGQGSAAGETGTAEVTELGGGGGEYNATYTPLLAGTYTLALATRGAGGVSLDGIGNLTDVEVVAGPSEPGNTAIPTVGSQTAGEQALVVIGVRDAAGNPRVAGGDTVTVAFVEGEALCGKILSPDGDEEVDAPALVPADDSFVDFAAAHNGDGTYNVTFSGTVSGTFSVNVSVNGEPALPTDADCARWPRFAVRPAAVSAEHSTLSGDGLNRTVAGETATFVVQARDRFGNARTNNRDGDSVALGAAPSAGGGALPAEAGWVSDGNAAIGASVLGVDDGSDGTFAVSYSVTKAGTHPLVVTVNGRLVGGDGAAAPEVEVVAAAVFTFESPAIGTLTAAMPADYELTAVDRYSNPVRTDTHTFVNRFSRASAAGDRLLNDYVFTKDGAPEGTDGVQVVTFTPSWHGNYRIAVQLEDSAAGDGGGANTTRPVDVEVAHATCAFGTPGSPFRCPKAGDRACEATYIECDLVGLPVCSDVSPVACPDGSCAANVTACACPGALVRCPEAAGGHCAASADECGAQRGGPCPSDALSHRCPGGECRADAASCPASRVCPTGLVLCADARTCALPGGGCDLVDARQAGAAACAAGQARCPDGRCAAQLSDCPTRPTCAGSSDEEGDGLALCPDGSCRARGSSCPDVYACHDPAPARCPDGSCRASLDDCPSEVTCPPGWTRCAAGGCAEGAAACEAARACPRNTTRCGDGSCRDNLVLCASRPTCPSSAPVACPDGSCRASAAACPAAPACPAAAPERCPSGHCAASADECPSRPSCPPTEPVLCSDGSCAATLAGGCPADEPAPCAGVRCPDGACRRRLEDCPSGVACPSLAPVRCPDGRCAAAPDVCAAVSLVACADGQVRCPGGACASSRSLCPTHVTCPPATRRCADGSCRPACPEWELNETPDDLTCAPDQVVCPRSQYGTSCAASLAECPSARVCPASRPVRCADATCAAAVDDCPTVPGDFSSRRFICADGAWQVDTARCGTPVSCPPAAEFLCWDGSCRSSPGDCPPERECGADAPFLCSSGECVQFLDDCRSGSQCRDADAPFLCPTSECVADRADCPDPLAQVPDDDDSAPEAQCPDASYTRCRDGSCVARDEYCAELECPGWLPVRCPSGMCAASEGLCWGANGCPPERATKCWDGSCVAAAASCPDAGNTTCADDREQLCWDERTCVTDLDDCPERSGCPAGQFMCHDRSCVDEDDASFCTDARPDSGNVGDAHHNACPAMRPFRCDDGACARTAAACAVVPLAPETAAAACPAAARPYLCADGSCVASSVQCPLLAPCGVWVRGTQRCGDGSCRDAAEAPCLGADTCPDGFERCDGAGLSQGSGRCVPAGTACHDDTSGCPVGLVRCEGTGECVEAGSAAAACADPVEPSGCASPDRVRCWNGACADDLSTCPAPNGCPADAPNRCVGGACVADASECDASLCAGAATPDRVTCADGSCAESADGCATAWGCPVGEPYRCADGSCRRYPARTLDGAGNLTDAAALSCPATRACPAAEPVLCADGTCQARAAFCRAVVPCPAAAPVRCGDMTCANATDACDADRRAVCPPAAPLRLADGQCVRSRSDGLSAGERALAAVECPSDEPHKCWDGSCRASPLECVEWAYAVHKAGSSTAWSRSRRHSEGGVCPDADETLCWNGACVPSPALCPALPACASGTYRCDDGSCAAVASACPATPPCADTSLSRCADGTCQSECAAFDGCSGSEQGGGAPYLCEVSGVCAEDAGACPDTSSAKQLPAGGARRRLLVSSALGWGCEQGSGCLRDLKTDLVEADLPPRSASGVAALDLAADGSGVVRARVLVPPGALGGGGSSTLSLEPVAASELRFATNPVDATRVAEYGREVLFAQTVLSPAFRCSAGSGQLALPLRYEAYVDEPSGAGVPYPDDANLPDGQEQPDLNLWDVCLGQLVCSGSGSSLAGDCEWFCASGNSLERRLENLAWTGGARRLASGTLRQCDGDVYAFVQKPMPSGLGDGDSNTDFFKENLGAIVGGAIGMGVFVVAAAVGGQRLYRYRKKYHEEKTKGEELEEVMEETAIVGGAAQMAAYDDIEMVANPLVVQLRQIEGQLDDNRRRGAAAAAGGTAAGAAASTTGGGGGGGGQQGISDLERERNQLQAELARLKAQMGAAGGAGAGAVYASATPAPAPAAQTGANRYGSYDDEPERMGFDGETGGAAEPEEPAQRPGPQYGSTASNLHNAGDGGGEEEEDMYAPAPVAKKKF